jgi:hypothetical protein
MFPMRAVAGLRALAPAMTLIITCASPSTLASEPDRSEFIGTWTITGVLDSSEISSIDEAGAAALVGKTLVISPDNVTVAGTSCRKPPTFTRHYEDAARYIRETAHAPVGRLGVPTVVEAVDLACTEALVKGYNRIVVYWQGFFFDAVKKE